MKYTILILAVLTLLVSTSCDKKVKDVEKDYITKIQDKSQLNETTEWLVILPGLGCHGCIKEGEVFMRDNIDNEKIFFVLTRVESLKILQHKIDINLKDHKNIYVQKEGGVNMPTNNRIYPCIVYLEKGEVKSYEFQEPGNNAFEKLRDQIALAQ
ncbi:hypothetical protein [Salegentibacter sp. Hel_I_6]|uniref:hypothetical protein n=1 Tax=Salegentibacter sp. Hel_I_6 TaxID=1250278 RepID=UPI0005689D22|nr:hypothetical protein [Salegentibacter sp. Hel_I_6]